MSIILYTRQLFSQTDLCLASIEYQSVNDLFQHLFLSTYDSLGYTQTFQFNIEFGSEGNSSNLTNNASNMFRSSLLSECGLLDKGYVRIHAWTRVFLIK